LFDILNMYMLRKFFIIAFLFIVGVTPVFAFDVTTGTYSPGECDYEKHGMRCGVGGCASDARCVYDQAYVLGSGTVQVGKCVSYGTNSAYPCASTESTLGSVTSGCMENCAEGFRRQKIATIKSGKVITCYPDAAIPCFSYGNAAGYQDATLSLCVADSTCTVALDGCNYNQYPLENRCAEGGCAATEYCLKVNKYDSSGSVIGFFGQCVTQSRCGGSNASVCELPSGLDLFCGVRTGCTYTQYCTDTPLLSAFQGNPTCLESPISGGYPPSCFSDTGGTCGKTVTNPEASGTTEWPADWTKTIYCKAGESCITTSSTPFIGSTPASYPPVGVCAKCVSSGCTGDIQPNTNGLDDCCHPDKRCSANGQCQDITVFQTCAAPNSGSIKPGTICKYKGQTENRCSTCPVTNTAGAKSYTNATDGNDYCAVVTYGIYGVPTSTCTNDCGCPTGSLCDNGTCKAAGSCIQKNKTCVVGGPIPCCNAEADVPYSCNTEIIGGIPLSTCSSPACDQVAATLNCTDETQSCCPAATPFCNNNRCGEAFECTSAGECCPGFGEICTDSGTSLTCEPADAGECSGDDTTLPPAPGYLGPQIEIPQLFSSIGAVLYPAGIGIGLFFIVRAGYVIMMSEGNPDEIKRGQEHLTSAIIGTLFIVLSTAILRVIINTLLG
jgi:hypothetical protein